MLKSLTIASGASDISVVDFAVYVAIVVVIAVDVAIVAVGAVVFAVVSLAILVTGVVISAVIVALFSITLCCSVLCGFHHCRGRR